jgi:hypothetical protein
VKMSIHCIPLQSFVYKFEIKKISIFLAIKVMKIINYRFLFNNKDNTVQYTR